MIYDAIINGARSLAFYGGNNPDCWNGTTDNQHSWNWTFWDSTLRSLIGEISPISPLSAALVNPGSTAVLPTNDASTEVISRAGNAGDFWVLAARVGSGTQAGDDLGPAPVGDERRRLHREPLGERGERRVDRQLRPVGCTHLPPRRSAAAAACRTDNRIDHADERSRREPRHPCRHEPRRVRPPSLSPAESPASPSPRAPSSPRPFPPARRAGRSRSRPPEERRRVGCLHGHSCPAATAVPRRGRELRRPSRTI